MHLVKLDRYQNSGHLTPSLRCPSCRQMGTFEALTNISDVHVLGQSQQWLGSKRCPNPKCRAHVFVVLDQNQTLVRSYPAELIDFDAANVPKAIADTFEEALICHAEECYVACAIMIRRTLEVLCDDKSAQGSNLRDRVAALRSKVVLPNELFSAMDELRLLGNDAAHIEAKTYDAIGKEETEVALTLTKEILKGVYQLDELVNRLKALKKP
ncbi:MAG: DUF4145 domain-containing protein [Betaproteobacteria bacterium]|nr:DUF4145 domain-containing protein [Betaproteobacteria bacterium]